MIGLRLKDTLSRTAPANEEDVLGMKGALQSVGAYETPAYGMTPYTDEPMFEGMKKVQKQALSSTVSPSLAARRRPS